MEKRLPLALALSLLFLFVYQGFRGQRAPAVSPDGSSTSVAREASTMDEEGASDAVPRAPAVTTMGEPEAELTARLDGMHFEAEWRNLGAALTWLHLLDYRTVGDEALPVMGAVAGDAGNLLVRDLNDRYGLGSVRWHLERGTSPDGRAQLVFTHRAGDGLTFVRTVTAGELPYRFGLGLQVRNDGPERSANLSLVLQSALGLVDEEAGSGFYGAPTALAVIQKGAGEPEVVSWSGGSLGDDPRNIADHERVLAAGTMTNYFASVLLPSPETDVRQVFPLAVTDHIKLEREVQSHSPRDEREAQRLRQDLASDFRTAAAAELQVVVQRLEPGASQHFDFDVYSGPKALEVASQPGFAFLTPVIESSYGMWGWINRTLLSILRFFHGLVGNWGVAIILLTVLVKGLLFPINRRQQTTMQRYGAVMQKLKPQLEELKAKYKNNMRKFNEEQMKLLKAHGASPPLGGCLLIFLQFPIWVSLFQILGTSIELRQSEFVGWIDDLSRPDAMPFGLLGFETLNLLPLLMAAATMVQMRFQAKPADDQQAQMQRIMGIFMPVIMLVFLYRYSAGLSLYIFTSSLIGIFEFQVIRRVWPIDVDGAPTAPGGKARLVKA